MSETSPSSLGYPDASALLSEAPPTSLSDLFTKDPEDLTSTDIARMVEVLRAQRERWLASQAERPKAKALPKPAATLKTIASARELDL